MKTSASQYLSGLSFSLITCAFCPLLLLPQTGISPACIPPGTLSRIWSFPWQNPNYTSSRKRPSSIRRRTLFLSFLRTSFGVLPLYVRDTDKTFMAVAKAFNEGVFINPVIPPACAPQDTLVRYALMATHTNAQVDESVEKLKKVFRELDILK